MGADEIFVCDITPRVGGRCKRDFRFLESIADQSRSPIAFGGGVFQVDDAISVLRCGFEKVVSNIAMKRNPSFYSLLAERTGLQSVVGCVEYRKGKTTWDGFRRDIEFLESSCGEILLIDVDRSGTLCGLNPMFLGFERRSMRNITACGGSNSDESLSGFSSVAASTRYMLHKDNVMIYYKSARNE